VLKAIDPEVIGVISRSLPGGTIAAPVLLFPACDPPGSTPRLVGMAVVHKPRFPPSPPPIIPPHTFNGGIPNQLNNCTVAIARSMGRRWKGGEKERAGGVLELGL